MRVLNASNGLLNLPAHAARIFVVALTLLPLAVEAVDGFDQPGSDYANFTASSAPVCRNSCGGDSGCKAWTWVKPGFQGPAGRCWLKRRQPTLVKNACCNSGSREYISQRDVRAEDHTDRPGLDYKNFVTDSWKTCEKACADEQTCAAWAYGRPGYQGPQGRCWLKSRVPNPVENQKTISGVKYKPASVAFDSGTNLIPARE